MVTTRSEIERELQDLRSRYAAYQRSARRLRMLIIVSATALLGFFLWILARFAAGDYVAGMFLVGVIGAILLAGWLIPSEIRWRHVFLSAVFGRDPTEARGSTSGQAHLIETEILRLENEIERIQRHN